LVACCGGLEMCLGDWHNTGRYSYLCLASCAGPSPTPAPPSPDTTGISICKKTRRMPASSIWKVGTGAHSCSSDAGIRGDAGFSCLRDDGRLDLTSIYVDMRSVQRKVGCFEWTTTSCLFPMRSVRRIDFDIEWEGCENLWMAPLWTFSSPWKWPQGTSGEIDFVEECPVPHVSTNLGCYSADPSKCSDAQHWGKAGSSQGPKHMAMTLDDRGNLQVDVCGIHRDRCRTVATYRDYLNTVYPTSHGRDNLYHFVSDIWNDRAGDGDGGWAGCHAVQNPSTSCRYAVTNIVVTRNSAAPLFQDLSSSCLYMNPPEHQHLLTRYDFNSSDA